MKPCTPGGEPVYLVTDLGPTDQTDQSLLEVAELEQQTVVSIDLGPPVRGRQRPRPTTTHVRKDFRNERTISPDGPARSRHRFGGTTRAMFIPHPEDAPPVDLSDWITDWKPTP